MGVKFKNSQLAILKSPHYNFHSRCTVTNKSFIPINPDLVWDYDIPPAEEQNEAFWRWYIARVLSRGRAEDLRAIGFDAIYSRLPYLNLPSEVRHFWDWYFNLPDVKERYGYPDSTPAPDIGDHWPNSSGS
jgi:hypothetical protein